MKGVPAKRADGDIDVLLSRLLTRLILAELATVVSKKDNVWHRL